MLHIIHQIKGWEPDLFGEECEETQNINVTNQSDRFLPVFAFSIYASTKFEFKNKILQIQNSIRLEDCDLDADGALLLIETLLTHGVNSLQDIKLFSFSISRFHFAFWSFSDW